MTKTCTKCGVAKHYSEFNPRRERSSLQSWCKTCRAEHARNRRANMPREELRREQRRDNLKKNYGIGIKEFESINALQGGVCAICGQPPANGRGKRLHVDHCHDSGQIRGLLCHGCNTGLGAFKEDPDRLQRAIEYLNLTEAPANNDTGIIV